MRTNKRSTDFDKDGKVKPDAEDYEATRSKECEHETDAEAAEHYRLAQAHKLIRLYNLGRLPVKMMREMDKIPRRS